MKKKVVSFLVATIMTVMAGVFTPAVTASVTISDSNVTRFPTIANKAGAGEINGVTGTEKTIGETEYYTDYNANVTTSYAYVAGDAGINADNYGWAHFKFAVSDAVDFVLQFELQGLNSNGRGYQTLFDMSSSEMLSISGTQQDPKDYTVDILFDFSNKKAYTYFNGIIRDAALEAEIPNLNYLRQFRFKNAPGVAHSYKVSGLLLEAFPVGATIDDILGYLTDSAAPLNFEKGTYFEGISNISGSDDIFYGAMYINGSSCSVSGDNTDGYSLTDTAIGGYYRYFLFDNKDGNGAGMPLQADDSVVRHTVFISPKSGNKTISVGKYSTQEELVLLYFDSTNAKICDKNGNTVLADYDNDTFYQVDFLFNNKDYEYSVYLDGKEISSGTLSYNPVGYISYKNAAAGDCMILKNIYTRIYAMGTSLKTVIGDLYGIAYIELHDFTVLKKDDGNYEISTAAIFNNISKNYTNPKIIYGLYKKIGEEIVLLNIGGTDIIDEISITNDEISLSYDKIDRKYAYGLLKTDGANIKKSDTLIVKAWLIANENSLLHLIDSNEISITVE